MVTHYRKRLGLLAIGAESTTLKARCFLDTPFDFDQFLEALHYEHLQVVGKKLVPIHSLENFFENKTSEESFNFIAK